MAKQTEMDKQELFRSAPVQKAVISLAVPTVLSQLIAVVYNMADTFFVGQLNDPDQVAAATLALPVFYLMEAFASLFGIGGASLISRCLGEGAKEKARHASSFCVWSALVVSTVYGILVFFATDAILPLLGANADTWEYCSSYIFWTISVGAAPTVLASVLAHMVLSEGYARESGFGIILGAVLNIILDPFFIFVLDLQISGAAIATMLSNAVSALYFLFFLYRIRAVRTITVSPRYFTLQHRIPAEILAVGLPSFIMSMMSTLSASTLNNIVSNYSNEAIAGIGIAKKIDILAFAIAQGMTQGTLPLIGYNYSSGNRKRMLAALKVLVVDCLVLAFVGTAIMFFGAEPLTRCFIRDELTVHYGQSFLRIIALACPTTSLNFLAIMVFQATGKKTQPLILSLLRKGGLDVPLMLVFDHAFGIDGVIWATPLADLLALLVSASLLLPYLNSLRKKSTVLSASDN